MSFAHLRRRRRVALLAADLLEGREREEVAAHVAACARCRRDHAELRAVIDELAADPVRSAVPEVDLTVLVRRVEREIEGARVPRGRSRLWLAALPAAAAVLATVVVVPLLVERSRPGKAPPAVEAVPSPGAAIAPESEVALVRLERNLAREHAAHYLSEARDVLVSVAATGVDCDREEDLVDVGEAPDRSRDLLARGTLLVEPEAEAVASARAVLDDVELALREVADLPSCVRRADLERLREQVEKRQLLMRIRLMTRELEG
jgi:anti-sigma factor RsiW